MPEEIMPQETLLLRHTVATLCYRGAKALRHTPPHFSTFSAAPGMRTPGEILAHVGDLLDWGYGLADGRHEWHDSAPQAWEDDVSRFFKGLEKLDQVLEAGAHVPAKEIFQGPVADALTHIGQIAMLRRMAGSPIRGENYHKAEIQAGRVGPEQAAPRLEFD